MSHPTTFTHVVFAGFRLIAPLGRGGMAEAFVAEPLEARGLPHRVCLKRLRPDLAHDDELVDAFADEARVQASLSHAHVARFYAAGRAEGLPFVVMELVDGLPLRGLLRRGPLEQSTVVQLAVDVSLALEHLHRIGVGVHRDVSPSNVMIGNDGIARLIDFGVATGRARAHATRRGVVKGKIAYMAPEQALGDGFDGRADLFSLGVVMYEALTGARPHDGETDIETVDRAMRGLRRPIARCGVSPTLAWCIDRLLDADPRARFRSARALLDALDPVRPSLSARFRLIEHVTGEAAATEVEEDDRRGGTELLAPVRSSLPPTNHDALDVDATRVSEVRALEASSDPELRDIGDEAVSVPSGRVAWSPPPPLTTTLVEAATMFAGVVAGLAIGATSALLMVPLVGL